MALWTFETKLVRPSTPAGVAVPGDLKRALAKDRAARDKFEAMAPSYGKAYVNWI